MIVGADISNDILFCDASMAAHGVVSDIYLSLIKCCYEEALWKEQRTTAYQDQTVKVKYGSTLRTLQGY